MKNPTLDLLQEQSFPAVADALRACAARVLSRWEGLVRETLPDAKELTITQLRDNLPLLIDHIIKALESAHPAATNELMAISPPHGTDRFHQHYDINELLSEYHVLRRVLIEEVVRALDRPMSAEETVVLNLALDTAIREGVISFAEHQAAQLRQASELHSKYLSFLSHDLRGGLNGALLMVEVLKRELQSEPRFAESLQDLDVMRRSILDTVAIMDRFLQAERLRRGKVQTKIAMFDAAQLLHELLTPASYTAREKSLELRTELLPTCPVSSDRELVSLIVQNLLSNAIKYTPHGVVSVSLKAAKDGCAVAVRDQGPGIEPDQVDKLFLPFTRGQTHGQGGVGLGLTIAKHAADLLGASIRVHSQAGEGSTFTLEVPNRPVAAVPDQPTTAAKQPATD